MRKYLDKVIVIVLISQSIIISALLWEKVDFFATANAQDKAKKALFDNGENGNSKLDRINSNVGQINKMMADIEQLKSDVASIKSVIKSAQDD
ncbi:MAG: hypothetical protein ACI9QD_000165 [Thermoproteota archaeon]|jgi:hypothetical protein